MSFNNLTEVLDALAQADSVDNVINILDTANDVVAIADRIDPFLTVLWNEDFSDYVGFKLKGFHAWYVERTSDVVEEEFNLLVEALEYYVAKMGDDMFPDDAKRKAIYGQVIDFVKRDHISIDEDDMQKLKAA